MKINFNQSVDEDNHRSLITQHLFNSQTWVGYGLGLRLENLTLVESSVILVTD